MSTGADIDVETVAKEGDLILEIGTSVTKRLSVSSKVLIEHSKVFANLLGPRWYKEQASATAQSPMKLSLPGDDPIAMSHLCHFLHGKVPKIYKIDPPETWSESIVDLAVVTDKYICGESMHFSMQGLLSAVIDTYEEGEIGRLSSMCRIAASAYLLDHPRAFQLATKPLMRDLLCMHHLYVRPEALENLMPSHIFDTLESIRVKARETIAYDLPDRVDDIEMLCSGFEVDTWPGDRCTVSEAIDQLKAIRNDDEYHEFRDLDHFIKDLKMACSGLCLPCIKKGKTKMRKECLREKSHSAKK